jgi:hypothetical protein
MRPPGGRYVLDLPTPQGPFRVEVRIRRDFVEIWHGARCDGVFDRRMLRDWLVRPDGRFTVDEVTLLALHDDGVGLMLHRIGAWALGQQVVAGLRAGI